MATYFLLNLQLINNRGELRQNLVCLLVVLELCCNQVREVAEGLGGVKNLVFQQLAQITSCTQPAVVGVISMGA
jgi:transcriptional regulator of aromatic amino acid metabolism